MLIAVAGCVAQAEGQEIIRRAQAVDLVVGSQNYHRLPAMIARAQAGERIVDTEFPVEDKFDALAAPTREAIAKRGISAFVTVQEGCDKFCTFCVVPYTRGAEVSRPVEKIAAEVERLAEAGVREVTLIGQNVNAYHGQGADGRPATLGQLLRRLARRARHRAAALHHQPSARHERRSDRRAWRSAGADALCASAGAVRLRPHAGGDEPPAYAPGLSRRDRAAARGARRPRLHLGFHRRLSRRDRSRFPRHAHAARRGRLRLRLHLHLFAAPGHARRRHGRPDSAGATSRAAATAAGRDQPPVARFQRELHRPHRRGAAGKAGPAPWATGRPLPISADGAGHGAACADRFAGAGRHHRYRNQHSVRRARRTGTTRRRSPQQELESTPCAHRIP